MKQKQLAALLLMGLFLTGGLAAAIYPARILSFTVTPQAVSRQRCKPRGWINPLYWCPNTAISEA